MISIWTIDGAKGSNSNICGRPRN